MDSKHLTTLEFPKVLDRLARLSDFSAGEERARALRPATEPQEIRRRLDITTEARALLDERPGLSLDGVHDIRPLAQAARRGSLLLPPDLLDVRDTLAGARTLRRTLGRLKEQYPLLADIAGRLRPCADLIAEIERCLDEQGEVRDDASPELARLRREERAAHERLRGKLQAIIGSPGNAAFLQEPIITQREGRYVIPLKADFKGRIRGIVHDVSASGATVFVEPLAVVELNNRWRELQMAERREVDRILARLGGMVAAREREIEQTVDALADLDLALAQARYAEELAATAPTITAPGRPLRLFGARHPLLDPQRVVPIDVVLDDETHVLVITGPNTGGKIVTLKTVGLLALMAQAGLHLPVAPGSSLPYFEAVYADIGDEQSIEQNLSTFSAHLTNILSFLDRADERSLVLLDELGAGTDPAEGAALARALLDHFRRRGATTLVATHYPELKAYAQLTPGVRNGSVEFDPETLSPTYRLTIGLPGRSNALAIARRLGMPAALVEEARQQVAPDALQTEAMLNDIHRLRVQAAQARDAAYTARVEAERLARRLRDRWAAIEREREEILAQARAVAQEELETLQAEVRRLKRRLQAAAVPLEEIGAVEQAIAALTDELETAAPELTEIPLPPQRPIQAGDTVWVRPLSTTGQVLSVGADGREAEVQVGPARTRVRLDMLELRAAPRAEPEPEPAYIYAAPSPGVRLDLRGCTVEEALERLDRHLDGALRAGLPLIHIIHGKGTGALRQAVRDFLKAHPDVSDYEPGREGEGGAGVTIAHLD